MHRTYIEIIIAMIMNYYLLHHSFSLKDTIFLKTNFQISNKISLSIARGNNHKCNAV